jgi:hypothetical protein
LAAVRDLDAAIALVGDLPHDCFGELGADRTCIGRLDSLTYGHGTVAASADLSFRKKVVLICPLDPIGRVRGDGACEVRLDH